MHKLIMQLDRGKYRNKQATMIGHWNTHTAVKCLGWKREYKWPRIWGFLGTVRESSVKEQTTGLNFSVESVLRGKSYWNIKYKFWASWNRNFWKNRFPFFPSFKQLSALSGTQWLKYPHPLSNNKIQLLGNHPMTRSSLILILN